MKEKLSFWVFWVSVINAFVIIGLSLIEIFFVLKIFWLIIVLNSIQMCFLWYIIFKGLKNGKLWNT